MKKIALKITIKSQLEQFSPEALIQYYDMNEKNLIAWADHINLHLKQNQQHIDIRGIAIPSGYYSGIHVHDAFLEQNLMLT